VRSYNIISPIKDNIIRSNISNSPYNPQPPKYHKKQYNSSKKRRKRLRKDVFGENDIENGSYNSNDKIFIQSQLRKNNNLNANIRGDELVFHILDKRQYNCCTYHIATHWHYKIYILGKHYMKISELNIYSNTNWCNLFGVFFIFFFVIF
jgi:hypothetical protein